MTYPYSKIYELRYNVNSMEITGLAMDEDELIGLSDLFEEGGKKPVNENKVNTRKSAWKLEKKSKT